MWKVRRVPPSSHHRVWEYPTPWGRVPSPWSRVYPNLCGRIFPPWSRVYPTSCGRYLHHGVGCTPPCGRIPPPWSRVYPIPCGRVPPPWSRVYLTPWSRGYHLFISNGVKGTFFPIVYVSRTPNGVREYIPCGSGYHHDVGGTPIR